MGRRPKKTFLQKRQTDGQEAHEKLLNIANYQRNANQNYNEVSPHIGQNGHHQKNLQIINAGEGVEKKEPSYTVRGNVNWLQPLWKTVWRFLKKIKNRVTI